MTPDNIDNDPANNREKLAESNRQRMTTPARQPQPQIVDGADLKAIEDFIYSTMNHTREWELAENAYQRILTARVPHTSPPAPERIPSAKTPPAGRRKRMTAYKEIATKYVSLDGVDMTSDDLHGIDEQVRGILRTIDDAFRKKKYTDFKIIVRGRRTKGGEHR